MQIRKMAPPLGAIVEDIDVRDIPLRRWQPFAPSFLRIMCWCFLAKPCPQKIRSRLRNIGAV